MPIRRPITRPSRLAAGRPRPAAADAGAVALARIEEIARNARTAWFGLLAYLAFVGVTLLGVRDIDFYSLEASTTLPLVNVAIPTTLFFLTAPWLGAALHVYLHLYLLKLWDALAEAPARVDGLALGDRVFPWLVIDWALRRRPDRDEATTRRPMAWLADLVTVVLVWLAAPLVLGWAWWQSMPAREELLTLFIAVPLAFSIYAAWKSWRRARRRLKAVGQPPLPAVERGVAWAARGGFLLLGIALAAVSWVRTENDFGCFPSETAFLPGADLAGRPADWISRETAERRFRVGWCRDRELPLAACERLRTREFDSLEGFAAASAEQNTIRSTWCAAPERRFNQNSCDMRFRDLERALSREWAEDRASYIAQLANNPLRRADLRGAQMRFAFLVGLDFSVARLDGANLWRAQLEGAIFRDATLTNAYLGGARLESADLRGARLNNSTLYDARLEESNMSDADLTGADLTLSVLEGANLQGANLEGADLSEARMERANLAGARLNGADLRSAAGLSQSQLELAICDGSTLLPPGLNIGICAPPGEQISSQGSAGPLEFDGCGVAATGSPCP